MIKTFLIVASAYSINGTDTNIEYNYKEVKSNQECYLMAKEKYKEVERNGGNSIAFCSNQKMASNSLLKVTEAMKEEVIFLEKVSDIIEY